MQRYSIDPICATTRMLFKDVLAAQQVTIPSTNTPWGGLRKNGFFKVSTADRPLITVITVVYNASATLEKTIQSVIEQTYNNVEYLIIDGNSSDGTLDIVRKYESQIDFWLSEPDRGIYDAMNKGIFWSSNGGIIAFLNADDFYIQNNVLEYIAQIFIERSLQMVYGKIRADFEQEECVVVFGKEYLITDLAKGNCPPHPATFIRKEVFTSLQGFDLQYKTASDYDLICKCLLNPNLSHTFTNRIVTQFRLGGKSDTPETDVEKANLIKKHFGLTAYLAFKLNKNIRSLRHQLLVFSGLIYFWKKIKRMRKLQTVQGD